MISLKQRTTFTKNLTYLRKINDISQKKLADFLGVRLKNVIDFENGENLPKLSTAFLIGELFEVTVDNLFNKELM